MPEEATNTAPEANTDLHALAALRIEDTSMGARPSVDLRSSWMFRVPLTFRCLVTAAIFGGLAAPSSATAETAADASAQGTSAEALAPVVVTARRMEEDIQRVPETVTALTPAMLKEQNIKDVNDLTYAAPSLTVATDISNLQSNFAIRGLSTGVTTYFSEAPCCGTFAGIPFLDVSQVQVLNGPQGTLFGFTSAAGAVLIDPEHPKFDTNGGLIDVTGGNYGRAQVTGVINIPVIEDHLAIRLAGNYNHVDGYTNQIPTGASLDEVQNQQYRIGIEFKSLGFDNYFVAQHLDVNESATSSVLAGANLAFPLFNLPPSYGAAVFGGVCAQAVSQGLSPSLGSCITQRLGILSEIATELQTESARLSGGGNAVRSTLASFNGIPLSNKAQHSDVVDIAQYDFEDVLATKLKIKNIAAFHTDLGDAGSMLDGIGGLLENGIFAAGPAQGVAGANNQVGNRPTMGLGSKVRTYTEELQLHGDTRSDLVVWTLGAFYSDTIGPRDFSGVPTVYQIFGGTLTPNLGYQPAVGVQNGQYTTEKALYGQGTLDLYRVGVPIRGLSITGGYRYTWDHSDVQQYTGQINYPSGVITPGSPFSTVVAQSQGYNYTYSISEQATDKLLFYATVSRAYVPGGVNVIGEGLDLPDYTPTYGPEVVLNKELGAKYDFSIGSVKGRVALAGYWDDFTDIIEPFTGTVGAQSFVYSENIAAARLQGVEFQATLIPIDWLELSAGYSYNHAAYTTWSGQDPFGVAMPGDPLCLPSSPSGQCLLDLKNNPFPYMPEQQAHLTIQYNVPIDARLGKLSTSLTGYGQTRVYYEVAAQRDLQLLPQNINDLSQAGYVLFNLRADWNNIGGTGWSAAAFVHNLADRVYATAKTPQMITLGFSAANYAPPRMFGIEILRKFGD